MNGATVTMLPTFCNPEKLSHQELIKQCLYLEDIAFKQGQALHAMETALVEALGYANMLGANLGALVDAYDAGDQAAILLQIKRLSETRKSLLAGKGRVH